MKTIEGRANNAWFDYQYTGGPTFERIFKDGFKAGAESEHDMLTKWNDPKEELPEYYKVVEIKYRISGLSRISIAWISAGDAGGYLWTIDGTDVLVNAKHVVGWRPIHE